MRFFFRSRQFKIILACVCALVVLAVVFTVIGGKISPQANLVGTITAPFRAAATKVSQAVNDFVSAYNGGNKIMLENAELESEVNELREQLADYEQALAENEFYKDYLEIKDKNPDFKFLSATLISRDTTDPYKAFTINKGSLDGVSANDPVITDAGLVGFVSEVGLTTSKVETLLSPKVVMGALGNRTNDSGIVSGSLELAKDGKTKFYNLSRSCSIAVGDFVVTSGERVFPSGILIGKIEFIGNDEYNTSIYATVEPFVNFDEIREVMVITYFDGQGNVMSGGE